MNKAMVKKHLLTHQLKTNGFKCNICSYKSEWRYSVKKHIISTHWLVPNAAVVKCALKQSNGTKSNENKESATTGSIEQQEKNKKEIKNELIDVCESSNNNENNNLENVVIKSELLNETNNEEDDIDDDEQLKQQIAAVKPSSFESSKLIMPNGKSYKSAFVPVTSNGTVISDLNSVDYANCTKKKMYFCESCPYKTNNYCNLKQHLLQHRPEAGHAKCRYCPYYVSMSRLLKQHEVLHPEYIPRERDMNNSSSNTSLNNISITGTPTVAAASSSQNNDASSFGENENEIDVESTTVPPQQQQQQQQQQNNETINKEQQKIYRCKFCPYVAKEMMEAKAHGLTHVIQRKAALMMKHENIVKNKAYSVSASSSSSSSSPSPSPSSLSNGNNYLSSPNQSRNQHQLQTASIEHLKCKFCDHIAKDSYLAIQHTLWHFNAQANIPKNFLFEDHIRNILNNSMNIQMPANLLQAPGLGIPGFPALAPPPPPSTATSFMPPLFQQPQQQLSQSNTHIRKSSQHIKPSLNSGRTNNNNGSEYIDISEYEKFLDVLQEAAG